MKPGQLSVIEELPLYLSLKIWIRLTITRQYMTAKPNCHMLFPISNIHITCIYNINIPMVVITRKRVITWTQREITCSSHAYHMNITWTHIEITCSSHAYHMTITCQQASYGYMKLEVSQTQHKLTLLPIVTKLWCYCYENHIDLTDILDVKPNFLRGSIPYFVQLCAVAPAHNAVVAVN